MKKNQKNLVSVSPDIVEGITFDLKKKVPLHYVKTPTGIVMQNCIHDFDYNTTCHNDVETLNVTPAPIKFETIIDLGPRSIFTNIAYCKHNADIAYQLALQLINHTL